MTEKKIRRIRLFIVSFVLITLLIPTIFTPISYALDDDTEAGFGEKFMSTVVRGFGRGIEGMFLSNGENKIDSVVFNENRNDLGITLLKGSELSRFFFDFYMIFQYIAGAMLAPIAIWISVYFYRAADDPQRKAELKDKLFKLLTTIVLLTSMPTFIDTFLILNSVGVDICRDIAVNKVLGVKGINLKEGMLMKEFYEQAKDSGKLAENISYLMTVFLNIWFAVYYFIRDLTISYLFMVYPVLAVWYPLKKGMVQNWYKEIASSIFTQSAHAVLLTIALGIAYIPQTGNLLFSLTAMACIIPMTAAFKQMIGLEGRVGAGKSMVGLGMIMGAYQVGKGVMNNVGHGTANIFAGARDYLSAKSDIGLHNKGHLDTIGKSQLGQSLPPVNGGAGKVLSLDDLKARKRQARNKILQGTGRLVGGSTVGTLTGLGMSVYGVQGAAMGLGAGFNIGAGAGHHTGNIVSHGMNFTGAKFDEYDQIADIVKEKNIDMKEAELEFYGLNDPLINGTKYQEKELKARKAKKVYGAMGCPTLAKAGHAFHTNKKYTSDELQKIDGVKMYESDKISALYKENRDGSIDILNTWEGNKALEGKKPLSYDVSYSDGEVSLTNDELVYIDAASSTKAKEFEGAGQHTYNKIYNEEYARLKEQKLQEKQSLRDKSGISNLTISNPREFERIGTQFNLDTVRDLSSVNENELIDITNTISTGNQDTIVDGVGVININDHGATIHRFDAETGKMSYVGIADVENTAVNGEMIQTGVKFKDGNVYMDQIKHVVDNINNISVGEQNLTNYDMSSVPQSVTSNVQAEDIIEITVTQENGQAYQNFVNVTSNDFLGRQSIQDGKINTTTRIVVNKDGNWQQIGQAQPMTTANMHNLIHSNTSVPYEEIRTYELGHKKEQLNKAIQEMKAMYDMPEINIDNEITKVI